MGRKTFRKKITSEEITSKINPENVKLWKRFIKEKNSRLADSSIMNYDSDLNIFFSWNLLYNDNKFFVNIKKIEFSDFFIYAVEELKWGSSRFGRVKSCLSGLSDFIVKYYDEEYPTYKNVILLSIENMPKVAVREKSVFSEDEINSLMDYLRKDLKNIQEACLLSLMIGSGARVSELIRFTTDIIDKDNLAFGGIFIETTEKLKTKGRGKTGKMMHKFIIKDVFLPNYEAWMVEREEIMKANGQSHNSLFIKKDGSPAQDATIKSWMTKWDKFLVKPFYPHSLRHYITSHLTRLGCSSEFIVEIMGWASADMYKIYNDVEGKDRKWKEIDKLKDAFKSPISENIEVFGNDDVENREEDATEDEC